MPGGAGTGGRFGTARAEGVWRRFLSRGGFVHDYGARPLLAPPFGLRGPRRWGAIGLGLVVCAMASPRDTQAQTFTIGSLEGTVQSPGGLPLDAAEVTVRDLVSGIARSARTLTDGRFRFNLLWPGEYDVFVERLGYRPRWVQGVLVRPGRLTDVPVTLTPAAPPVDRADVVPFYAGGLGGSRAGASQWFSSLEIRDLPDDRREAYELGRFSTSSSATLETEALPGRLSGLVIDGIGSEPAAHPDLPPGSLRASAFPLSALESAELVTNGVDVEWSELSGASLSGHTRRGTRDLEVRAFGAWSGDFVSLSSFLKPNPIGYNDARGGLLVRGPIRRDTAYFAIGLEGQVLETPFPRAWEATSLDSALLTLARDSFGVGTIGVGLDGYVAPRVLQTKMGSAFGRFDWSLGPRHILSVRGNFAFIPSADPDLELGPSRSASLGALIEGSDLSSAATLTSSFTPSLTQELRVFFETSQREYRVGSETSVQDFIGGNLPSTILVDSGLRFGADVTFPGRFEQNALRASETLYLRAGSHRYKFGIAARLTSYDHAYSHGLGGEFIFSGLEEFGRREGYYVGAVGPLPVAKYTVPQYSAYLQDTWATAPGVELTVGIRYDLERLPRGKVTLNEEWLARTGLANDDFEEGVSKLSPRFGFLWDVRDEHRWLVRADAGIYHGLTDPGLLSEVLTHDGRMLIRRGLGTLSRWIGLPDSATAPVMGPRLALLGPKFEPPRTARASLGISRLLGAHMGLHLSGTYRRTDFLPRRSDLNLLPRSAARDQYGRPIYGTLVQQRGLLAAAPGSNRRFSGFDLVSALSADGVSDYWGLTFTLERRSATGLNFVASYTYSQAEDNWLSGQGGGPDEQLSPFPEGLNGRDWADGHSDFDVPHRVVLGAEVTLPALAGIQLAALYRYRSGTRFTPGFRDGVDANGDGSARNDPAFVDDGVPGIPDLVSEWDCLRDQIGRFAERNSCHGPGVHSLDVRLGIGITRVGRYSAELILDGLNLVEASVGLRDRALYLVDGSRLLSTDPSTGTVTVPLVANPGFGGLLARHTAARMLRVGLRMSY